MLLQACERQSSETSPTALEDGKNKAIIRIDIGDTKDNASR